MNKEDIIGRLTKCKSPWHYTNDEKPEYGVLVICAYYTGENSKFNPLKGYRITLAIRTNLTGKDGSKTDNWLEFQTVEASEVKDNDYSYYGSRLYTNNLQHISDKDDNIIVEILNNESEPGNFMQEQTSNKVYYTNNKFLETIVDYWNSSKPSTQPEYWMSIPLLR